MNKKKGGEENLSELPPAKKRTDQRDKPKNFPPIVSPNIFVSSSHAYIYVYTAAVVQPMYTPIEETMPTMERLEAILLNNNKTRRKRTATKMR